jgi:hypothetical protein
MRKFMLGAVLASFTALGGCSTAQIEQAVQTMDSTIQAAVAGTCQIIPTLGSIADVVLAVTGQPSIAALSNVAVQAVETDLCSAAPTAQSARYKALPLKSALPATIGRTKHGVVVSGWRT